MGEGNFALNQTSRACRQAIEEYEKTATEALRAQTPGGVFEVHWNSEGKATAIGQLVFFAEFLQLESDKFSVHLAGQAM